MNTYTLKYQFKDRVIGFENQITVQAANEEQALEKAKTAVKNTYPSPIDKFTFKFVNKY